MKYDINFNKSVDSELTYIFSYLPIDIVSRITCFLVEHKYTAINEIRIKSNSYLHLIADSKNVITDIFISDKELEKIFEALCRGSIYAHADTIKEGYIALGNGIRAGICGKAITENNILVGIRDVSSINIRIPQVIHGASNYIYSLLVRNNFSSSVLIYSPPGVGKTSILRDLVIKLSHSSCNKRYAVIDTREEIITSHSCSAHCDTYISYPKGQAIELATKSMTPEIIICDEISNESEATAILKASNSGVLLIATAHASSFEELKSKVILKPILEAKIFNYFIGVKREYGEKKYKFSINKEKHEALM